MAKKRQKIRTRSSLYLSQMSDEVIKVLNKKSKDMGVTKWKFVEAHLEKLFGIDPNDFIELKDFKKKGK